MRLFDKLTGGGVDWQVELASSAGAYHPGDQVAGRVRYTPKGNTDVRAIRAALVASEQYVYMVKERGSSVSFGSSKGKRRDQWERKWFSAELFRQDLAVSGPTQLSAPGEFEFNFPLPADAAPSFDSPILRLRWQIRAWMDVGGRDPSTERDFYVITGRDRLSVPDVALAPSVLDSSSQPPASIYLEPAPLVAGQSFRGFVETTEQLDLRSIRVELKQHIATSGGQGGSGASISLNGTSFGLGGERTVAEERVLWTGQLTPMQGGQSGQRYQFAGQLALAPVGTVSLPHGSSTATLDVVINRRLLSDRHIVRPVAIVTG